MNDFKQSISDTVATLGQIELAGFQNKYSFCVMLESLLA
jgi:hypothetical protein